MPHWKKDSVYRQYSSPTVPAKICLWRKSGFPLPGSHTLEHPGTSHWAPELQPGPDEAAGFDFALPECLFFVLVNSLILESRKYLRIQVVLLRVTLLMAHSCRSFTQHTVQCQVWVEHRVANISTVFGLYIWKQISDDLNEVISRHIPASFLNWYQPWALC